MGETNDVRFEELRCLKIDDRWLKLILNGQKTWEIRRTNTKIRGRIALGNTTSKKVEGYAILKDSFPMNIQTLLENNHKHRANAFITGYAGGKTKLYVWVLEDIQTESNPKPYSFSTGSWCHT